jgi:cytochrome c-type biogenesis protein CcmH/NrfG
LGQPDAAQAAQAAAVHLPASQPQAGEYSKEIEGLRVGEEAWLLQAGRLMQEQPVEAATLAERVLQAYPTSVRAQVMLAMISVQLGDTAKSERLLRDAIRLAPDRFDLWFLLGDVQLRAGKLRDAEAAFRETVRLQPAYPYALHGLGSALQRQGRAAEAVEALRTAVVAGPNIPHARAALADALAQLGRTGEAADEARRVLAMDPQNTAAKTLLERLGGASATQPATAAASQGN